MQVRGVKGVKGLWWWVVFVVVVVVVVPVVGGGSGKVGSGSAVEERR